MSIYFIHCQLEGTQTFKTKKEWEQARDDYDFLGKYCDDGWSEYADSVLAGIIPDKECIEFTIDDDEYTFLSKFATHRGEQFDIQHRPEDVGEDGWDSTETTYWGEFDYICNYHFAEIPK